jgi:hypothetical protein
MFGINSVTLIGRVLDNPIDVSTQRVPGLAFRVQAQGIRTTTVWCYSLGRDVEITKSVDAEAGKYVMFHGSLWPARADLRKKTGDERWAMALCGRVRFAMSCCEFSGDPSTWRLAPTILTGMVVPGVARRTSAKGKEFLTFWLHSEQELDAGDHISRHQCVVPCVASIYKGVPELVVPGAVLLCRGNLCQSESRFVYVECMQVESLGLIQEKLVDRYRKRPAVVPRWILDKQR